MTSIMKAAVVVVLATMLATNAYAEGMTHKVVVHVDQNDKRVMNMALNNVQNINKYYESKGDKVIVELVA